MTSHYGFTLHFILLWVSCSSLNGILRMSCLIMYLYGETSRISHLGFLKELKKATLNQMKSREVSVYTEAMQLCLQET